MPVSLLVEALGAARTARLSLLATMSTALAAHTRRRGSTGPSTQTMQMSPDNVVGGGGVVHSLRGLVQDLGQQLCFPHCMHGSCAPVLACCLLEVTKHGTEGVLAAACADASVVVGCARSRYCVASGALGWLPWSKPLARG